MGYFPTVQKGDKVSPTAVFHNAVVRTVNRVMGDPQRGIAPLARTRVTIPVLAAEDIPAWNPVELDGDSGFSYGTRAYTARQARSQAAAIGIARDEIKKDTVGSVTVFGLELVDIPDNSTGDYLAMKDGGDGKMVFTRTTSPTSWRLLDAIVQTPVKQVGHIIWKPFAEAASSPWAFEATATPDPDHEGNYNVSILGGTAQSVGGKTAICQNQTFTNIANGELFFLRLSIWDANYEPTVYWHYGNGWDTTGDTCQVEHAQTLPTPSGNERWIALVLAKLDNSVPGNIVQYRAGAIDVSATLSAGVAGSGITVRTISTAQ